MKCLDSRVGGSEPTGRYGAAKVVTLYINPNYGSTAEIEFSADEARAVARRLKKWADFIEPTTKRRT